jgi:hypothetical protein
MEDRHPVNHLGGGIWGPQYSLPRDGRIKFGQGLQGKPTLRVGRAINNLQCETMPNASPTL